MGVSRRAATALTIAGAVLAVAGIACLFWQLALIVAGLVLAVLGLFGVEVEEGSR